MRHSTYMRSLANIELFQRYLCLVNPFPTSCIKFNSESVCHTARQNVKRLNFRLGTCCFQPSNKHWPQLYCLMIMFPILGWCLMKEPFRRDNIDVTHQEHTDAEHAQVHCSSNYEYYSTSTRNPTSSHSLEIGLVGILLYACVQRVYV